MKRRATDALPGLVTAFFQDHLQRVRGASPHTVRAYAYALRLYLAFLADVRGRPVSALRLTDLDVDGVVAFLDHLERHRSNCATSRNSRLAALRSFFHFLVRHDPANAEHYHRVLALPSKRARVRPARYLEPEQVRAILAQPDRRSRSGVRDRALLLFLYNTGARVAEALAVGQDNLELRRPPSVRLRGKGNRERICPLWRETVMALTRLVDQQPSPEGGPLFRNARGERLSRDGVAYILAKHVRQAAVHQPGLRRRRVTPHVLRHSCAVALLQAGVDLTVIRDYLGHASFATTSRYVTANLDLRRTALEAFWKRAGLGSQRTEPWRPKPDVLRFLESL